MVTDIRGSNVLVQRPRVLIVQLCLLGSRTILSFAHMENEHLILQDAVLPLHFPGVWFDPGMKGCELSAGVGIKVMILLN